MNRAYAIVIGVAAAFVVGILLALSLAGGTGDDEADGAPAAVVGVDAVSGNLEGVAQAGNVLGDPAAPVEIIEYGDLACPACKLASETTVPEVVAQFVRDGRAKLVFRPIAFISPSSERGALGAEAAAEQDAMWSLVELLYRNQGDESSDWLTDQLLEEAVTVLGLDLDIWRRDYRSATIERRFAVRAAEAQSDGVQATPTFVVRGPRGERTLEGVVGAREVEDAIGAVGP